MTLAEALALAFEHHQAGRLGEAVRRYREIVAADPAQADAWHLLGVALHQQGKHADALPCLQTAIQLSPRQAVYHNHLGAVQGALGQPREAEAAFRTALAMSPRDPQLHFNLGVLLAGQKRIAEAESAYRQCLALDPRFAAACFNLGNLTRDSGRTDEAISYYQQATRIEPKYAEAWNNLGSALQSTGRLDEALQALESALALRPGYQRARINLGVVFTEQRRYAEAEAIYRDLLAEQPQSAETYNNLGVALMHQGRLAEAEVAVSEALRVQPDYLEAQKNQGVIWLFQGDQRRGWPAFEARLQLKEYALPPYPQPIWDGRASLVGKTILLLSEQGLGDSMQFVRYAQLVKRLGARVYLRAPRVLVPLLSRVAGIDAIFSESDTLPGFDTQVSLMSLPARLGAPPETSPMVPYLTTEPERAARWREEVAALPGIKIGINWQGNPAYRADRFRSAPLANWLPLARVPGVTLLSLQKQHGLEQLPQAGFSVVDWNARIDGPGQAFLDTAAIMQQLDLVITTDTATAHLAGGLGVKVWVVLEHVPEWRWQLAREDCPWYPSMRLWRCGPAETWRELFQRMAAELAG